MVINTIAPSTKRREKNKGLVLPASHRTGGSVFFHLNGFL
jgi:hypothetical protein